MSERLTILVIVGTSTDQHSLRSQVGMGSDTVKARKLAYYGDTMRKQGTNGESTSMMWPTLGSRTAKEQNTAECSHTFTMGPSLFPSKLPLPMGDLHPIWYMIPRAHLNPQSKRYLDRFCRAHDCDRPTDRQTDRQTTLLSL